MGISKSKIGMLGFGAMLTAINHEALAKNGEALIPITPEPKEPPKFKSLEEKIAEFKIELDQYNLEAEKRNAFHTLNFGGNMYILSGTKKSAIKKLVSLLGKHMLTLDENKQIINP